MADTPEAVLEAVEAANADHPDDVGAAIAAAIEAVQALPQYEEYVEGLVNQAIGGLVYGARHTANVKIRRAAGRYGGGSKMTKGSAEVLDRVYAEVYSYRIAGTVLGDILGKELAAIASGEEEIAIGHRFNAELCRDLARLVPEDKCVRDAVKPGKLEQLFRQVRRRVEGGPAAATGD